MREQTSLPLTLFAAPTPEGLSCRLLFDAKQIDGAAAQRLLDDVLGGLRHLARAPQARIGDLPIATRAVPAQAAAPRTADRPQRAQGGDTAALGAIWQAVLDLPQPPRGAENFFDLGGHSLLVITLQDRIRQELGCAVEVPDLFRHATLTAQAAHLHHLSDAGAAAPATDRITARADGRARLRQRRVKTQSPTPSRDSAEHA